MNLNITQKMFEGLLPFMGTATEDVFTQLEEDMDMIADELVENVVVDATKLENALMRAFAVQWVVWEAVLRKMRSHDLILTDSGFGVVSTQNVAPASRERVDALEKELEWQRDYALVRIIGMCRDEEWAETTAAVVCIPSLLWRPDDVKRYAHVALVNKRSGRVEHATFDHVQACRASIDAVMNRFSHNYSTELAEALLREERAGAARTYNRGRVVNLLLQMMGEVIAGLGNLAELTFGQIGKTIERHEFEFPEYVESEEYKVNHGEWYENTLRSRAFFF